jgi:vitamin B12 transporter
LVCFPQIAAAQERDAATQITTGDAIADRAVTILVDGVRQPVGGSGEAVSVFDRDDLDRTQGADLARALERAPGVSFNRNGAVGAFTGIHVRGAESEQLLVLIDGVRASDPAAPGGGFDLGTLLMGNLAKVELQRSSNSTIWGSDAIGGVLAVTTGQASGLSGALEAGSYGTAYGTLGAEVTAGPLELALEGSHFASDGFSAAASGTEPDGFRQTELAGRATIDLPGGWSAFARARYAKGRTEIDGFPAPAYTLADTAEFQDTRQLSGVAGVHYASDALEITADYSAAQTRRANFDPAFGAAPGYTTDGLSQRAEVRGRWSFARSLALDFGGEREWTRFASLFDPRRETAITGGYAQFDYDRGPLHLAAGVRRDEHRDFGGQWSFGADGALDLSEHWRITASYGEGFKAPTLFQLASDFGNAALRPETSRSYDAGIAFSDHGLRAKLTVFRRDTRDLIGFVSCFGTSTGICLNRPSGTYDNIGRARAQGIELEARAAVGRDVALSGAYAYLVAEDRTPGSPARGNDLARRPNHLLTASADWTPGPFRLGADLRVVSRSFDDAPNAVRLGAYTVATLRAEWDMSDAVTLYGRVENLGDDRYQTAAGYGAAGRSAYLGARARF